MIDLSVEYLRTCAIVRPSGSLGTCGFHPKPWQMAYVEQGESPLTAFLEANPNWKESN